MIFFKDVLAWATAAVATAGLGAIVILPAVYPAREVLGYLPGVVQSYDVTVTKLGGTRGTFAVRLDRGEVVLVAARAGAVPGMRVCVRAVKRGERINGFLVADSKCPAS